MTDLSIQERAVRAARGARGEATGTIYFIQGRAGTPVKIGFTQFDDIAGRMASLQTANPYPLVCLLKVPGNMQDERTLHKALSAERLCGEWFEAGERLDELMARISREGIKAAVEAVEAMQAPEVPQGWDRLATSETNVSFVFSLSKPALVREARLAGSGPPFMGVTRGKQISRFYALSDLRRWFVANRIPHRPHAGYWRAYVFEFEPEATKAESEP